jgi:hypothetical protein
VVEEDEPEEVVVYCPTALSGELEANDGRERHGETRSAFGSVPFGLAHIGLLLV